MDDQTNYQHREESKRDKKSSFRSIIAHPLYQLTSLAVMGLVGFSLGLNYGTEKGRREGKQEIIEYLDMTKDDLRQMAIFPIKSSRVQDSILEQITGINSTISILEKGGIIPADYSQDFPYQNWPEKDSSDTTQ